MEIPPFDVTGEPLGRTQVTVGLLASPVLKVDTSHSSVYSCPTVAGPAVVTVTSTALGGTGGKYVYMYTQIE